MGVPVGLTQILRVYGDPRGRNGKADPAWERENLAYMVPPFQLYVSGSKTPIRRVRIHRLHADCFAECLQEIWNYARVLVKKRDGWNRTTAYYDEKTQELLDKLNLTQFGGCYVYRAQRGSSKLSSHSWGIASDWDTLHNQLGHRPTMPAWWVRIWKRHGCAWGGDWKTPDGMHVQACKGY